MVLLVLIWEAVCQYAFKSYGSILFDDAKTGSQFFYRLFTSATLGGGQHVIFSDTIRNLNVVRVVPSSGVLVADTRLKTPMCDWPSRSLLII